MPAPSNKKKAAKKAPASKPPPALATPATAIAPTTSTLPALQPPIPSPMAAIASEQHHTFDFAFFVENATFNDINQFVNAISTTKENQNLQLLWRRAVREGRDLGYEKGRNEGYEEGYEVGYRDCAERGTDDNWEHWEAFERSLGAIPQPGNEPKSTTASATAQTEFQINQSTDTSTQTDYPPPQQLPTVSTTVDASPSPSMAENMPETSMAASSASTSLELENDIAFRVATSPAPPVTEIERLEPPSATLDVDLTSHDPRHPENATFSSLPPVHHQESSVQTPPAADYEIPADPEVLVDACTRASVAASDTPLGAIWECAKKSGFDEGASMVDGILVTDILKTGFEKGNLHGIMAERDHHSQTCPNSIPRLTCEAGTQVIDADPLNSPEAIDVLCAFSSTAPSTTLFGLIWERAFQAGTKVTQALIPNLVDVSTQTVIPSSPPPPNATLDWSEELVEEVEPMFPPPPPKYEPRDLSILRSSSPAPFSSLERRSTRKRSHTRPRQSHRHHYAISHFNSPQKFTAPKKSFHSKIPSSPLFPVTVSLDWDRDSRLSNLSSALKALGWVQGF